MIKQVSDLPKRKNLDLIKQTFRIISIATPNNICINASIDHSKLVSSRLTYQIDATLLTPYVLAPTRSDGSSVHIRILVDMSPTSQFMKSFLSPVRAISTKFKVVFENA